MNTDVDFKILIVGNNSFNNSILLDLLKKETGLHCRASENLDELKTLIEIENNSESTLILWDNQTNGLSELWPVLREPGGELPGNVKVAVYNTPMDSDIGLYLLQNGGHGIFYQKDSPGFLVKGISAILEGELWVSRNVLQGYISKVRKKDDKTGGDLLTNREREIITWLVSGRSNEEIAESLNISPHTVRTHLSNIYSKLEVNNRFQAALWAADNL